MSSSRRIDSGPTVEQRLADSELVLSLAGDLARAGTEDDAIDRILGIFTVFCAPRRVCYLQIVDDGPGFVRSAPSSLRPNPGSAPARQPAGDDAAGEGSPASPESEVDAVRLGALDGPWEMTASTRGFRFRIEDVAGPIGVVEVEGVAVPAFLDHYVNLGLGLVGVCALAIRNARTYDALQRTLSELQQALSEVKTLRGVIPICASCKRIRDDVGAWSQVEAYVSRHSECVFSHSICPACVARLYPEFASDG